MLMVRRSVIASLVMLRMMALLLPAPLQAQTCDLIGPAVIKGKKFFDSRSGKYIPLKGVNYYPRPNAGELSTGNNRDFFAEEYRDVWERDIEQFQKLGINVVRLYAVNPGLDHSGFMCALQQAGIYAIIGLAASCQDCAITGQASPDCYPGALKERGQFVINIFAKYENVLAFSAGNEAHLFAPGQPPEYNAPCQKQFIRDMRAYIDSCENLRKIPIGVAVADRNRDEKALYYNCRSDPDDEFENAEWYGLNVYLHCDGSAQSIDDLDGFNGLLESHQSYNMNIPVVLSEFGCTSPGFPTIDGFEGQRNFLQVEALYTPDYEDYFAGGIAFEFSAEKTLIEKDNDDASYPFREYSRDNWGLGYYTPETCNDIDIPCTYTPYPEFDTLASKFTAASTSVSSDVDTFSPPDFGVTECPANFPPLSSFTWESASIDDLDCVGPNYVFICPKTPPECLPPFAITPTAASPPPTTAPTTGAPVSESPTASPTEMTETPPPTEQPVLETPVPTKAPTLDMQATPTTVQTTSDTPAPVVGDESTPAPAISDESTPAPVLPDESTPAPSLSDESTSAPSSSSLAVEFQPTNLIVAATSAGQVMSTSIWLLSMPCLLLVFV